MDMDRQKPFNATKNEQRVPPDHVPPELWDAHIHLFPEKLMRAIYRYFSENYRWHLPFPADTAALIKHLREDGVKRAFVLAYVHKPGLSGQVNRWLASVAAEQPWLVPFGAAHPEDPDLKSVLSEALDRHHFAGIKLHCLVQQISADDERLFPIYEALVKRSRALVIHATNFPLPDPKHLGMSRLAHVLKRFPTLLVAVAHLGLNELPLTRELLQQYRGLYLDTAFVFQNNSCVPPHEEIIRLMMDFPGRILYGSDFPFILEQPANGIQRIMRFNLPPLFYHKLFYQNASDFLRKINITSQ